MTDIKEEMSKLSFIKTLDVFVEQWFEEAQADMIGLWDIVGLVDYISVSPSTVMETSLHAVALLLDKGLRAAYPPYLSVKQGLWEVTAHEVVVRRIEQEWITLGRNPLLGDIVCLVWPKPSDS